MTQQNSYVAGFLIDRYHKKVVLVSKLRPKWQAGKLNGVGGRIEDGETPHDAMVREFTEEAGHFRTDWEQFCVLGGPDFEVYFFRAFDSYLFEKVRTMTDERIHIIPIEWVTENNAIPNLQWLLPMALSIDADLAASSFEVREVA